MWEIEPHLQKDETIEFSGQPSFFAYWFFFLIALLFIWTIIIPIIFVGLAVMLRESTKYVITNKRVAGRVGIITENFKSSTFKHITSLRVRQGVIGRIFNFGDIVIDTSGSGPGIDFRWVAAEDPIKVKNMIENHIE